MSAHMSGWDVSSTPTWGPEDGPEDTQAFKGQDFGGHEFGRGGPSSPAAGFPEAGGGFAGESRAGGPPSEFFGQEYGQDQEPGPGGFPQRTPGGSFQNLPRRESRGRHSSAPGGAYGQDNGFGQEGAYGHDGAFGQEGAYGQDGSFGQDGAFGGRNGSFGQDGAFGGRDGAFAQENGYGQENGHGQDSAYGQGWGGAADQADNWGPGGQENDGGWGHAAGRPAAPWDERPQQDAGYPGQDGQEFGQQDFGRQDYTRQAPGFTPQDYDGQDFHGQQGFGPQEPQGFGRGDRDSAARMDPALQDFFVPERGGTSGYQGQGPGRPGEPRDPRFRPPSDGWEGPGRPQAPRAGTGPRPMPRGPRRDDPEPRRGLGMRGLIAIGTVVAIIIVVAVVLVTHKSGGGSPTASNTTGGTMTTPAAKPSASKKTGATTTGGGGGTTTAAYTLSTPATAGGYPLGQNPHFVATATATAAQITTAVASGGGGKATGAPVSASYQLPASQVITFVGYQGTFTPAKVEAILASLGSNPHTYPAGPNGGILGCANTTVTPSAAVCVWATSSTLGVTEFFTATGPETLNAAQPKGAADTVNLRAGVEKKKA
jgi:hypothetical protein